jgi:ribosomal protein S18 acetylase RimI-like enzyme
MGPALRMDTRHEMTETHSIEVLDLRHFSAKQLRPLLEEEASEWERRLGWDYRSSTELLLQYLDSRILPGFVASYQGRVCGMTFCVYEGPKAVIGDLYVSRDFTAQAEVTGALLTHLLDVLEASPEIERIESQLLLFDTGTVSEPFRELGFRLYPRLYQEADLTGREVDLRARMQALAEPTRLPVPLELRRWSPGFYQATAELIHSAYEGHLDANINDQYRTLHGSLRFLHNIVRFPGCGVFDANGSWVLRDPRTNLLVAAVLCSRIGPGMAHVTQLCVAPAWRGHRLGQMLMLHCMVQLLADGYGSITLTVTEANDEAVRLYGDLGFATRHRFEAMVRDKDGAPYRIPVRHGDEAEINEAAPTFAGASIQAT